MHEPISASLSQLSYFAVLGFFLGAFYEIIRIIRLFRRQSDLVVGITDFLFLSLAGLITFAYSMELGKGTFRWFFAAGVIFGGTVYFLTIGRLISLASNLIVKFVKLILSFVRRCLKRAGACILARICVPFYRKLCEITHLLVVKIGHFYGFMTKRAKNSAKHLKSRAGIVYNSITTHGVDENNTTITGEKRNVIKGKVRKTG